ncbi:O114 family O-antigen flippase [Escherichia coli]|uniref:O-antigen translocase n=1 Tax=Escherichia coli TaxID=562 RepID=UPI00195BFF38|nr:O-antigen translocase [Escherichia coli]QRT87316.1 O114 family O-antigen flippase [Escherichia coli]
MKKLLTVTFFTGMLTFFKMISGFIISKIVAIYTGPSGIVLFGQIQSIVSALNGVINSPVGPGIVRFTAENHRKGLEHCYKWWIVGLSWVCIISAIIIPLSITLSSHIAFWTLGSEKYSWVIILTACLLPLTAIGTFISSVINGFQNYKVYVLLGIISAFLSLIIMIALIVFGKINGALLAISVQNALIGGVMIIYASSQPWFNLRWLYGRVHKTYYKDIQRYIVMAITSAIVVPGSLIIVRNIIIHYVGWTEAGYWQAVWKISETYLAIITIALSTYYLPRLSSLSQKDDIIKEISSSLKIIIPLVMFFSMGIYLSRDFIISLLFTKEFLGARMLFQVQLIGDILKIASWLYAYVMISKGMTQLFVISEVLFSLLFISFSLVFIRCYGLIGVTYAYCLNYFIYLVFSVVVVKRAKYD